MLLRSETLARSGSCPARHEETWPEIRAGLPESGQAFAAAKPAPFRRPQVNFTGPRIWKAEVSSGKRLFALIAGCSKAFVDRKINLVTILAV